MFSRRKEPNPKEVSMKQLLALTIPASLFLTPQPAQAGGWGRIAGALTRGLVPRASTKTLAPVTRATKALAPITRGARGRPLARVTGDFGEGIANRAFSGEATRLLETAAGALPPGRSITRVGAMHFQTTQGNLIQTYLVRNGKAGPYRWKWQVHGQGGSPHSLAEFDAATGTMAEGYRAARQAVRHSDDALRGLDELRVSTTGPIAGAPAIGTERGTLVVMRRRGRYLVRSNPEDRMPQPRAQFDSPLGAFDELAGVAGP